MTDTHPNAPDTDVPESFDVLLRDFFRREMPTALRTRTVEVGDLPIQSAAMPRTEPVRLVARESVATSGAGGGFGRRAVLSTAAAALVLAITAVRWSGPSGPATTGGHPAATDAPGAAVGSAAHDAASLADRPRTAPAPGGTDAHPLRAGGAAEGRIVPVGVDPARLDEFDPAPPSAATELPELQIEVHRLTPSRPDATSPSKSPGRPRSTPKP